VPTESLLLALLLLALLFFFPSFLWGGELLDNVLDLRPGLEGERSSFP
jgi:hypothetical protein